MKPVKVSCFESDVVMAIERNAVADATVARYAAEDARRFVGAPPAGRLRCERASAPLSFDGGHDHDFDRSNGDETDAEVEKERFPPSVEKRSGRKKA